ASGQANGVPSRHTGASFGISENLTRSVGASDLMESNYQWREAGDARASGAFARRLTQDGTGRPDADASPPTALRSLRRSSRYGSVARLVGGAPRRPELRLPSWVN